MHSAPKGRNVSGIIPLSGFNNSFDFPWPDYLQPLREGMLAVERSVYECAYAGCDSIWIVCNDNVAPLLKDRLGDYVMNPRYFQEKDFVKRKDYHEKWTPIFYTAVSQKHRDRRDSLAWSILHGSLTSFVISSKMSQWCVPTKYFVSFPQGIYHPGLVSDHKDAIRGPNSFFLSTEGQTVRENKYTAFTFFPEDWPKFKYRSGSNIAQEMITHYEKHGVTKFYFTDSLINGSLKAFNDMCEKLAKYNSTHKAGFSWGGQFIFRPKRQLPQDHFKMIAEAGGNEFYVGVETGSDKIRWEMDKKFTNEDIDYQLEEFNKNNLHVYFLMLIGYATETIDDHNDTLKMFQRWQKYVATGTIAGIDLGVGLMFMKNTPLEKQIEQHGAYFLKNDFDLWQTTTNPDLDVWERVRRRIETHKEAIKYNWPIWRGTQRLEVVKQMLLKYEAFLNKSNQTFKPIVKDGLHFIN